MSPALTHYTRIVLTLLLAAAGGAVCWKIDTPLPWMIGAMTVVTIAALSGLPVRSLAPFRATMITVLCEIAWNVVPLRGGFRVES